MTVGILIITHNDIGVSLLHAAERILGFCPLAVETLSVAYDCDVERAMSDARLALERVDAGDGVLVLTDLFGSTPSNVASALCEEGAINVLAGVNLPMLMKVFNYPALNLDALTQKARDGGVASVVPCRPIHHSEP